MIYQFNDFELDSANFCLNKDGQNVEIEPQVFNLITYLIENRNKLVTRDEIFEQLWADRKVLDATLSNHIKNARSILGDDGQSQKIIKTVRGRGYQFAAEIKEIKHSNPDNASKEASPNFNRKIKISLLSLSLLLVVAFIFFNKFISVSDSPTVLETKITPKSIAILPFDNRSDLKKDEFFTDGFHDDLLTQVSKIHQLKTISRTSVMSYRNTTKNIRAISNELGVTTILEGGVQRAGNEIRINVQLIDALTDEHLWAESYTRDLNAENIFTIQTEISRAIAEQLEIVLAPQENKIPTQNLAALEAYFKANTALDKNTNKGYTEAIAHLEHAIELDSEFAIAYAELGSRYLDQIYLEGLSPESQISKAKPLIELAIKLDKNNSHAYRVFAKLNMYQQDFDAGKLGYQQAIKLNSNNAEALGAFGGYYMYEGDIHKAVELLYKAKELNPNDDKLVDSLSSVLLKSGRFDEAKTLLENIIQRKPGYAIAYRTLSDIQFFGDHEIAISLKTLHDSIFLDPEFIAPPLYMAMRYEDAGNKKNASKWLEFFLELAPDSRESGVTRADIYILQNELNKAFDIYFKEVEKYPNHLYTLLELGEKTGRVAEAVAHCQKITPALFHADVIVDSRNMATAFVLGRILKSQGKLEQANRLLEDSLKIAKGKGKIYGGRQSVHHNWVARILLAIGDKKAALASFKRYVKLGFHSYKIIEHSDYNSLHGVAEYQRLVKIMETRLEIEQKKLHEMEINGELDIPLPPTNSSE